MTADAVIVCKNDSLVPGIDNGSKDKEKGGDDSAPQDDLNLESDAFLDAASEGIEWAEDHRSGVIGGIIAVAVAVALGFGYTQYEASANQMPR